MHTHSWGARRAAVPAILFSANKLKVPMNIIEPAATESATRHDPYAALRFRDFRLLVAGTVLTVVSERMLGVAVGWELYERTRAPLGLGLIGLVQVLPVVLLALPAGHVADRFDRKWILVGATLLLVLCALGLAALSLIS